MRTVIFVPSPDAWRRDGTPGGLSLLERQMKQVRSLGLEAPLLLVPHGDPVPVLPGDLPAPNLVRVPAEPKSPSAALAGAAAQLPPDFIFLSADRLVDARVLRALEQHSEPVFACVDGGPPEPIGRVSAPALRRHGATLLGHAKRLPLAAIDPYEPELHGVVPPYIVTVRSAADRHAAWRVLLDHVQKRALDLPGQYFDTPFENFLLRRLAPTRLTPNHITVATIVLAGAVGALFLDGWLRTGVVLAMLVGILDGVDGKLARLKLATSQLGELEHVADFFYENFWYLAIATHLHGVTGMVGFWRAGLLLVALDLSDNLLYLAVRARTGKTLDEVAPFDRAFRRIAGRRNVYVMLFATGFLSGHAAVPFVLATLWAGVTVAVHAVRAARVFTSLHAVRAARVLTSLPAGRHRPALELDHASEIEPATGALVSEK